MKDEIHINGSDGHNVVEMKVLDWIDYYNHERYQWSLAKLSPVEYYQYVTTGEYPILVTGSIAIPEYGGSAPEPPEFNALVSREGKEKDEAAASPSPQT